MSSVLNPKIEPSGAGQKQATPGAVLAGSRGSPLGIDTGTAARLQPRGFQPIDLIEKIDSVTGEILQFQQTKRGEKVYKTPQQSRAERYALKSVVNEIFPNTRYSKCSRCRRSHDDVTIHKSKEHGRAFYGGLVVCGSPWACPVCAAKIAERRRVELQAATAAAQMMGLSVALATFTIPHGLGDDIASMLDSMAAAWRFMTMSRGYKELRKFSGLVGTVRALEVTHGQNGFHPHFHVLMFCKWPDEAKHLAPSLELLLCCLWRQACVKKGLPEPSRERGVKVDDGSWAARYASKWGLEDEMTKGHLKTSKGIKGRSPWDFLRSVLADGCEADRRLFAVYAQAFKGRRQLYWSNGLRELLGLDNEATDEELAAKQDDEAYELSRLSTVQWRAILFNRAEAAVLDLVERDPGALPWFLDELVSISQHERSPSRVGEKNRIGNSIFFDQAQRPLIGL